MDVIDRPEAYLIVSALLFCIGVVGFILRRNLIVLFMCIELMLNAVNLTLMAVARYFGFTMEGQLMVFLVMAVAAAETAVGLAVVIAVFRRRPTLDADDMSLLNG
jgi:NADH-quinone oxidoreductase subunit K